MFNSAMPWRRFAVPVITSILLAGAIAQAQAAVITTKYLDLGNHHFSANLTLTNDSDAAGINEFTVYFDQGLFSGLSLLAAPAGWDNILAQPDKALASNGFFDSYLAQGLALGQKASFTLGFTYAGQIAPAALPFDIVGADFLPTSSGFTSLEAAAVPEPAPMALIGLAAALLVFQRRRQGASA